MSTPKPATNGRSRFQATIAIVLLLLYAFSTGYLVFLVLKCAGQTGCQPPPVSAGLIFIATAVGGLVSALVAAKAAVMERGDELGLVEHAYVWVWLAAGLTAAVVGWLLFPDLSSTLSDIGKAWVGVALATTYAYFGIRPKPVEA